MIKCRKIEKKFHYKNDVTLCDLTADIPNVIDHVSNDIKCWALYHPFVEVLYVNPKILKVKVIGATTLHKSDTYDKKVGTKVAECKAMSALYRFCNTLTHKLEDYYREKTYEMGTDNYRFAQLLMYEHQYLKEKYVDESN